MARKLTLFIAAAFSLVALPGVTSIIKRPPEKPTEVEYKNLACSEQDQANIYQLICTLAEKGKLGLLFQQSYLREIGAQINHVHPLKFLAVVFKDPHLKSCMYYIWNDYFKRNGFMDGLGATLTREHEKGKLNVYLKDFADDVGVSHEALKNYVNVKDWENLVLFLIQS